MRVIVEFSVADPKFVAPDMIRLWPHTEIVQKTDVRMDRKNLIVLSKLRRFSGLFKAVLGTYQPKTKPTVGITGS